MAIGYDFELAFGDTKVPDSGIEVRGWKERAGLGDGKARAELIDAAKAARKPPPPEYLVDAKHDRVHRDPGGARSAKSVKSPTSKIVDGKHVEVGQYWRVKENASPDILRVSRLWKHTSGELFADCVIVESKHGQDGLLIELPDYWFPMAEQVEKRVVSWNGGSADNAKTEWVAVGTPITQPQMTEGNQAPEIKVGQRWRGNFEGAALVEVVQLLVSGAQVVVLESGQIEPGTKCMERLRGGLPHEWFRDAKLVAQATRGQTEKPVPKVGQVWRWRDKRACSIKLTERIMDDWRGVAVSDGLVSATRSFEIHAGALVSISGFEGYFENAELVHDVESDEQEDAMRVGDKCHSCGVSAMSIAAGGQHSKGCAIDKALPALQQPISETLTPCPWCNTPCTDEFCCPQHKADAERYSGARLDAAKSEREPDADTVTVAGITMSRKRYNDRWWAYENYWLAGHIDSPGDKQKHVVACACTRGLSTLQFRDLRKKEENESQDSGHPWSADDADYVVTG